MAVRLQHLGGVVMGYWVRFRFDGVPDAYSGAWFDGAEWVEGVTASVLETRYRSESGEWVERPPEPEETEAEA